MDSKIKVDSINADLPNVKHVSDSARSIKLLCYDIQHFSVPVQFFCCCTGVFIFYLMYGYLQELIFTLEGFKPYGWYLTLVQFGYYSIFGYIEMSARRISERKIPAGTYLLLAALTLGTMGFSNSAVGYLNYPTQVIFKCCKLIPVLVGGVLIQKKRYGALDVLAACSMCAGLALFTLADSQVSPNFDTTGVVMISCALVCDAAIGNVQEKSMKMHNATNTEVVFYSYFIGFLYLTAIMAVSGDFIKGALFCAKHPWETYGYGLLFSMSGYLGIQIVLTLVKTTGALVAATVTTCRKAVTIMISFIFFSKPFTFQYVWSGLLVILGIYINIYSKNQQKIDIRAIFNKVLNRISVFTKQTKYPHYRKILSDV